MCCLGRIPSHSPRLTLEHKDGLNNFRYLAQPLLKSAWRKVVCRILSSWYRIWFCACQWVVYDCCSLQELSVSVRPHARLTSCHLSSFASLKFIRLRFHLTLLSHLKVTKSYTRSGLIRCDFCFYCFALQLDQAMRPCRFHILSEISNDDSRLATCEIRVLTWVVSRLLLNVTCCLVTPD